MAKPLFVFATQRSGTNFLRYCLATDKRIVDLNEIFGFNVRPALFWRHRKKVLAEQPEMVFPSDDNMSKLFESFILEFVEPLDCLLYTSPSPRDKRQSRMPSSA